MHRVSVDVSEQSFATARIQTLDHVAHSVVTTLTELSQLRNLLQQRMLRVRSSVYFVRRIVP